MLMDVRTGLPTVSEWARRLSPVLNGGSMIHSYAHTSSSFERVQPFLDKRVQQQVSGKGYIYEGNAFRGCVLLRDLCV